MIKTEMSYEEVREQINDPKYFNITYSYHDRKGRYDERTVKLVGYSLGDCKEHLQTFIGGREITILTHNSGEAIHNFTRPVVRSLIKKNYKWYDAELRHAAAQVKQDLISAKRATKIDRSLDGLNQAQNNKKLEAMHGKVKHRI